MSKTSRISQQSSAKPSQWINLRESDTVKEKKNRNYFLIRKTLKGGLWEDAHQPRGVLQSGSPNTEFINGFLLIYKAVIADLFVFV